ncbi:cobalt transporter [Anaerosporomusa subterranea]|uniref:Cobalt transporter n=1 Tax=Anaerosporomusa subterranea TaxID=1794912 RepID=A0A154BSI0_ANASB|nr:energy-coupling factor transporter transmembrane component T [Anaerosporomusa subterranea]KYZ76891.1 cobalt transporter [Anaerosporomusa subterranea]
MVKLAPLTRLIATFAVSIWAFILQSPLVLTGLAAIIVMLLFVVSGLRKGGRIAGSLALVVAGLIAVQYLLGTDMNVAIAGGLRMVIMSVAFIVLFASTRAQDLTTALVTQCHIPYEFAFLFTSTLRFVPDLLAESQAVQEAQACRGYTSKGGLSRLVAYLSVVQPLVLRSVSRSETMAMSLELRGFNAGKRSFLTSVALGATDYLLFVLMAAVTMVLIGFRAGLIS